MAVTMDGIFVNGQKVTFAPEDILSGDASAYTQEIGTAVEAWMEENVTGGEQVTDTTLTLPGVPADADVTGDKIDELKEDLNAVYDELYVETAGASSYNISFLKRIDTDGSYITASSGKYCVTDRFSISGHTRVDINAKSGYELNLFFYSSNSGNAQDYYTGTTGYKTAHNLDGADLAYVAIVIRRLDQAVIDTSLSSSDFFEIAFFDSKMDAFEAEVETEITEIRNNLVAKESGYQKTSSAYATGWLKGYYSGAVGDTITLNSTSTSYIRLHNAITVNNYPMLKHASFIEVAPPGLYAVRIFELDANDVVTGVWGNTNTQSYPEDAGKAWKIPCDPTKKYRINMGRFDGDAADKAFDTTLINATKLRFYVPYTPYKFKTFDYEFFAVDVSRPLTFGDEEKSATTETVEAVLRLPSTYDPYGEPTRLVLACHGASGYIQASTSTWYNDNWKTFMDALLDAGYAVFDANIFPTSEGTSIMGQAVGSPLYVNVLKKAYDYIQSNYNVTKEIFAHGTSMGGVGATAFAHAYPHLVLAESSFAGRDFIRYLYNVYADTATDDYAKAYGYATVSALNADKYSHAEGLFPCLSLVKIENGVPVLPPDRDTAYSDWIAYFSQLGNLAQDADAGDWSGKRAVPYKAWNSWADNVAYTKLQTVLQKAYNRGNSCPYYIVNYDSGTHTQMSYGQINDMIPQLIAWFKRWE